MLKYNPINQGVQARAKNHSSRRLAGRVEKTDVSEMNKQGDRQGTEGLLGDRRAASELKGFFSAVATTDHFFIQKNVANTIERSKDFESFNPLGLEIIRVKYSEVELADRLLLNRAHVTFPVFPFAFQRAPEHW
jgi:hypothetical protein